MFKRFKAKSKSKKGGIKEIAYDNLGLFITIVLVVVLTVAQATNIRSVGNTNSKGLGNIQDQVKTGNFDFDTSIFNK